MVFKRLLFFSEVNPIGECLLNVPEEEDFENIEDMTGLGHPGMIWNPNDQCKMIYGENATFCQVFNFDLKKYVVNR